MTTEVTTTPWNLKGKGYEFCNCDFGCGCNFGGRPNSKDGSCRAFVGFDISEGACGDVDLSGVKCAAIIDWPKAIHEGNGKCVFVVDPATTDAQVEQLAQIFPAHSAACLGNYSDQHLKLSGSKRPRSLLRVVARRARS